MRLDKESRSTVETRKKIVSILRKTKRRKAPRRSTRSRSGTLFSKTKSPDATARKIFPISPKRRQKTTGRFARHAPNAPFATDDGKFARRRKNACRRQPFVKISNRPSRLANGRRILTRTNGRKIESWRTWPSETRRSSRRGVAKSKPTYSKTSCERAASQRKRLNEAISSDFGARRTDSPERRRFNESEKLRKTAKRAVGRPPRPREKSE